VIRLYEILLRYRPAFESSGLSREKIFSSLFPAGKYNAGTLYMLFFYLNERLNKYLCYRAAMSNENINRLNVLEEKMKRGLVKDIWGKFLRIEKKFLAGQSQTDDFEYHFYRMKKYITGLNPKIIQKGSYRIDDVFEPLNKFYYLSFLELFIKASNVKEVFNMEVNTENLRKTLEKLDAAYIKKDRLLSIYYNIALLYITPGREELFFMIRKDLSLVKDSIEIKQLSRLYRYLKNYCIRKTWKGINFSSEEFSIIKEQIADKRFTKDYMTPFFYMNAVKSSLTLNNPEWTIMFINKFRGYLKPNENDGYYHLAMGYYCFQLGEYRRSLEHTSKVKGSNIFLKLDIKFLESMNYYKLELTETLFYELDSYNHLIRNDRKLTAERKSTFLNFIKYLGKLARIKEGFQNNKTASSVSRLYEYEITLNKIPGIAGKEWLLSESQFLVLKFSTGNTE
jgi:hypothetical protein